MKVTFHLPEGPGLGVEVDEAKVIEVSNQGRKFNWPNSRLADGSVADY